MRLFVGIPLSAAVLAQLASLTARLRRKDDALRWTAPDSWHITLAFLGNTAPEQLQCLAPRLAAIRSPQISIQLGDLATFPRAAVFFAAVQVTPPLLALHQSVAAAILPCGFQPDARPFHPHITLARAKGQSPAKSQSSNPAALSSRLPRQLAFAPFTAREFLLYESFLEPTVARYEIRAHFPLQ
jgi:2'-5' RNA ligase